MLSILKPE
jgi:hypothetical protein